MVFKKGLAFLMTSAIALSVAACGSDSSSNADRESDSSSSFTGSSSSGVSSSSSVCDSCATASDLGTNMTLGKKFGATLWLSAGKNGLYSLWFIDSASTETSYGTIALHSDLSGGVLSFDSTAGYVYATNNAIGDSAVSWITKGFTLAFTVSDGALMVSIDGASPVEVETATRQVDSDYLSKATALENKALEWDSGDSLSAYYFYENGEYVRRATLGSEVFEAGYYDVHRQHLLMLPAYFIGSVSILNSYTAKLGDGTYVLDNQQSARTYAVSSLTVDYPDSATLSTAAWSAKSNDTLKWTLSFATSSYTAKGRTGLDDSSLKIQRSGAWSLFGDYLVLQVVGCNAATSVSCPALEVGQISDLSKTGFSFDNADTTSEYALPSSWTAIVEE